MPALRRAPRSKGLSIMDTPSNTRIIDMISRTILAVLAALSIAVLSSPADARPTRAKNAQVAPVFDAAAVPAYPTAQMPGRAGRGAGGYAASASRAGAGSTGTDLTHQRGSYGQMAEGVIGGRPAGCPRRYCGCGVSIKVFGRIIPELNLAANWVRKFPRTSPAAGMVAARSGHVFYINSVIDAKTVMAYDPNSGGGKTRIHERALRGYVVVNPHSRSVADHAGPRL